MEVIRSYPPMLPVTAESIMRTAYRVDHGMLSPAEVGKPFANVKYTQKEDVLEGSLRYSFIRRFYHFKLGDHFGLSLTEFFDLPYDTAVFLCEMGRSHQERFNKIAGDVESDLENQMKGE